LRTVEIQRPNCTRNAKRVRPPALGAADIFAVAFHEIESDGFERRAELERLIFPRIGDQQMSALKQSNITKLRDVISDENGPAMAKIAIGIVTRIFNWHEGRTDDFKSPLGRGVGREKYVARSRVLSDDELRAVWRASFELEGPWGRYIRFLLLTAARRSEASDMEWGEITGTDTWIIPSLRCKIGQDVLIPLSSAAQAILTEIPRIGPYVFTVSGPRPIGGFTDLKIELDRRSGVSGWVLHDLRRSARTLMSRAGVEADIAERCLGHVVRGIRGIYDRHDFEKEKRLAFEKLAALIEHIVSPQENVTAFRGRQ
jgi:integrase